MEIRHNELAASFAEEQSGQNAQQALETLQEKGPQTAANQKKDGLFKKQSEGPDSLAAANRQLSADEILEKFAEKMSKNTFLENQAALKGAKEEKANALLQEFMAKEGLSKQDKVQLSSAAMVANKGTELEKKQRASTDQSDDTPTADIKSTSDPSLEQISKQEKASEQLRSSVVKDSASTAQAKQEGTTQTQQTLQKYMLAYSESLLKADPKKQKEVAELKQKLMDGSFSPLKLQKLESNVQGMIRSDLRKQVKKSFIDLALTYNSKMTPELMSKHQEYTALANFAGMKEAFPFPQSLDDTKDQAKTELRSFVSDELDQSLVEAKVKGKSLKEIIAAFDKLNHLAGIASFNAAEYMGKFQKKIDDLGLKAFRGPEAQGVVDTDFEKDTSSDGSDQGDSSQDSNGDTDITEDQLRTLFMQKALRKDLKSKIEINFKIHRLKNGLKRLGIYKEERFKQLQEEGEAFAKMKFVSMLHESFQERACLPKLEGPDFELVKNKIKAALKGLKQLGAPLAKQELTDMMHQANRAMFTVVKEDFLKVDAYAEGDPKNKVLKTIRDNHKAALERMKSETDIVEDIKPAGFQTTTDRSSSVIEAA
ncbi:MAG: hypothetical protein AB7F28_06600 [Candidatus Margulisiibacteriota bacterium]